MFTKPKVLMMVVIVAALQPAGCFKSKTEVTRVPKNSNEAEMKDLKGVFYSLPRTVVTADVPVKRTSEKPGVLEKFTPCFYPPDIADERVMEESTSFGIEEPTVAFRVEPDPDQHFVVSVKGGYFENKSLLMEYAPGGILKKGEASSENQALDFTIQAAKSTTKILTGIAGIPSVPALRQVRADESGLSEEQKAELAKLRQANLCYEAIVEERKRFLKEADEALQKAETDAEKKAAEKQFCDAKKKLAKAAEEAQDAAQGVRARAKAKGLPPIIITADDLRKEKTRIEGELKKETSEERRKKLAAELQSLSEELPGVENLETELAALAGGNLSGLGLTPVDCQDDGQKKEPKKTPPELITDYERAKETFDSINTLEGNRLSLVGGATGGAGILGASGLPVDTLKAALKELDTAIEARKALFFGTSTEKTWTGKFEYAPENQDLQFAALFWFAKDKGLCPTRLSEESGVIIPEKFLYKDCLPLPAGPKNSEQERVQEGMDVAFLSIQRDTDDQDFRDLMQRVQDRLEEKKQKRGWYYRIPAPALVTFNTGRLERDARYEAAQHAELLLNLNQVLGDPAKHQMRLDKPQGLKSETLSIAQLGATVSIPASGAGRTNQANIEYDDSGALKNFKYTSNSLLQKSQLEELEATAQTVVDAKKASNEEKAKAADPLEKMKRELEILETQNKINEERKKLNQANGNSNAAP